MLHSSNSTALRPILYREVVSIWGEGRTDLLRTPKYLCPLRDQVFSGTVIADQFRRVLFWEVPRLMAASRDSNYAFLAIQATRRFVSAEYRSSTNVRWVWPSLPYRINILFNGRVLRLGIYGFRAQERGAQY